MSYNTQQDILDFVEDNNVKFVRFAFCDIFGTQKNIAVLASSSAHCSSTAGRPMASMTWSTPLVLSVSAAFI